MNDSSTYVSKESISCSFCVYFCVTINNICRSLLQMQYIKNLKLLKNRATQNKLDQNVLSVLCYLLTIQSLQYSFLIQPLWNYTVKNNLIFVKRKTTDLIIPFKRICNKLLAYIVISNILFLYDADQALIHLVIAANELEQAKF